MSALDYLNKGLKYLFYTFLAWLFIHLFMFQVMYVDSGSMGDTLFEGDYIIVNKMAFGARMPITPLSLPFGQGPYLSWIKLPYLRFFGYSHISHGDIIVFNLPTDDKVPVDERQLYIKRCVALPGEVMKIDSSRIYIDGKVQEENILTKPIRISAKDFYNPNFFPNNARFKWNLDYFGPLKVPKKGDTVNVSLANIDLYSRIILVYEGNKLEIKNEAIYINDTKASSYTFKMNYYFTLGDNRHNSIDSRYWGFVPEDHIIGKTSMVLYSKTTDSSASKQSRTFLSVH